MVGAGPGGSAAAKKCAKSGLKVLLVEKHALPRYKVCAGWIMGSYSKNVVTREFGEIPLQVLNNPPYLKGFTIHTPDGKSHKVEGTIPQGWRKKLDYWMTKQALDAGVELYDEARVINVAETSDRCNVRLVRKGREEELNARFVIGSDGSLSIVRKCLYPNLQVPSQQVVQLWYKGSLKNIDRDYSHDFLYRDASHNASGSFPGSLFNLGYKEEFFYVGITNFAGRWKDNMAKALEVLAQQHGFDINQKPSWTDGCVMPRLHKNLIDGSLRPAIGNILLVGDAAGLLDADGGGGGISGAADSGSLAADSIIKTLSEGGKADNHYIKAMGTLIRGTEKIQAAMAKLGGLEQHANGAFLQTAILFAQRAIA